MKRLLLSLFFMMLWFWPIVVHAEDPQQTEEIPEEQKQLTFEEIEAPKKEQIEKQLFQKAIQETNTIQAKTTQIGLFSNPAQTVKMETKIQTEEGSYFNMVLVMVAVMVALIGMFVFVVPKLKKGES